MKNQNVEITKKKNMTTATQSFGLSLS